jgi:hypothetical protein
MAFVEALQPAPAPERPSAETPPPSAPAARPPAVPAASSRQANPPATAAEANKPAAPSAELSAQDQQATQTLAASWQQILSLVRQQDQKTYGVVNSCKSRYMKGNHLVLIFASDVLKSKMEKPENIEIAQKALTQVFQRPISVVCKVDTAQRDAIPPGVDDDGMVAAALRDLGGELVDIQ